MKNAWNLLTGALLAISLMTTACSTKSNGGSTGPIVTPTGCATPGYVLQNGLCVPGGSGSGTTTGPYAWEQWLNIVDNTTYQKFLEDLNACPSSNCGSSSFLDLRIDLASNTLPAMGRIAFNNGMAYVFVRTDKAYPIVDGFEFRVTGNYMTPSWNDIIRVVAKPTDTTMTTVDVEVYYNNVLFASGPISRIP